MLVVRGHTNSNPQDRIFAFEVAHYFYSEDLITLNKTDKYVHLYTIKVNNNLEYYDEYIRTKVTWLTIFANSFSLWMSLFSSFSFLFDFLYAKNFNNYKIIKVFYPK